jgi:hypothetical protein
MNATMERVTELPKQQSEQSSQPQVQPQVQAQVQAPPAPHRPISYAAPGAGGKRPLSQRINFRMLIFAGIVLFLLGWPVYTFLSESLTGGIHNRGAYSEVNLKAMGQFDFDPTGGRISDVPPMYRALDGHKVLLEGEIYAPTDAGSNLTNFQLVYSIQKCCFNGPPRVQERVFCTVPNGSLKMVDGVYHKVFGTLHVTCRTDAKTGLVDEVYHLDAEHVEPAG